MKILMLVLILAIIGCGCAAKEELAMEKKLTQLRAGDAVSDVLLKELSPYLVVSESTWTQYAFGITAPSPRAYYIVINNENKVVNIYKKQ